MSRGGAGTPACPFASRGGAVIRFGALLDRLSLTPGRLEKLRLLAEYFATPPDPDRGYALAALTGGLTLRHAKPALVRDLVARRVDPALFAWSYDFVGDLAETVALIWPGRPGANRPPELAEVAERLRAAGKAGLRRLIDGRIAGLDGTGRWALRKLITRALRAGASGGPRTTSTSTPDRM